MGRHRNHSFWEGSVVPGDLLLSQVVPDGCLVEPLSLVQKLGHIFRGFLQQLILDEILNALVGGEEQAQSDECFWHCGLLGTAFKRQSDRTFSYGNSQGNQAQGTDAPSANAKRTLSGAEHEQVQSQLARP